jgi:enterochelin esterase family protein
MNKKDTGISPRLQRLQEDLRDGDKESLQLFWNEIKEQGAPLVEEIEGDSQHRWVTFLWQANANLINVTLVSLLVSPTTYPMKLLPKSDIWYTTLRLPSDLRATYQFFPNEVAAPTKESPGPRWSYYKPDPLNPHTFAFYTEDEDPTEVKLTRSVLELPDAPSQPWVAPQEGVLKGKVHLHTLSSDILGNERRVWVYSPVKYTAGLGQPYPLLVLFDGWGYANLMPTFTILDNMIADQVIRPTVAVLVDSLDMESRMKELSFHPPFNDFLVTELLPWILMQYSVSTDPAETVVGGSSAGGLAAVYAALEHPDVFGNVLSQSGAFTINPGWDEEGNWLARQFELREKLPIKFHLDAGTLEVNSYRDLRDGVTPLAGNQHMRDVLVENGYEVHYTEFSGGHDYISWQGTFGEGLAFLLR